MKNVWGVFLILLCGSIALATGPTLTHSVPNSLHLSGHLINPDGTSFTNASVSFKISIAAPSGTCVLYQEQINGLDMSSSNGNFELQLGSGTRNYPTAATNLKDIFSNLNAQTCADSSTYTPTSLDSRKIQIQFYDGATWRAFASSLDVSNVPYSLQAASAETLSSYAATDFVLKTGIPTCTVGDFLSYDGTNFSCAAAATAGGTLTSVSSANSDISVASGTTTPVLTLNSGTSAGQLIKLDVAAKLPAVDASALTGLNASNLGSGTVPAARMPSLTGDVTTTAGAVATTLAKIQGTTLTVSSLASGNFLKYNGTAWVNVSPSTADLSDASSLIKSSQMPANCNSGQTLVFTSPTGTWNCSTILVSGSNFNSQTANTFLAGPTTGSSSPTFRAIIAADLPAGTTSQWTTSGLNVYYNAGNVGIGTATPTTALQVIGTISATAFSGPLVATTTSSGAGSASSPSMTFTGDPDTGFYDSASNNRIGVTTGGMTVFSFNSTGLLSPTAEGAFIASAAGTAALPTYSFAGDSATGWWAPALSTIAASTAGAERIRIDSSGNVGIGTNAPSALLDLRGDASINGLVVGRGAGNSQYNVAVGGFALFSNNASVTANTAIGYEALFLNTTGSANTALGYSSLYSNTTGTKDVALGASTLSLGTNTSYNTAIGNEAGQHLNSAGSDANVFLGYTAGAMLPSGSGNTFLGAYAGQMLSGSSSNNIIIGNYPGSGAMSDSIVLADAGIARIFVNSAGNVGIGTTTPSYTLHVIGTAGLSSGTAWTNASDIRLKDIHGDYDYGLNEVLKLHTVRYSYKKDNALGLPSDFEKTGFIAQEVQKVIPDAVNTRKDGYLELNVDPIHWAVVNSIKDLYNKYILSLLANDQKQDREIASLKAENAALKERLDKIEAAISKK